MNMHRSLFPSVPLSLFLAMTAPWWTAPAGRADGCERHRHDVEREHHGRDLDLVGHDDHQHLGPGAGDGVVTGGAESVSFSGKAKVSANVVTDPDFGGTPTVVLSIDLSGLSGVGASTRKKYVTADGRSSTGGSRPGTSCSTTSRSTRTGASAMSARVGSVSFNLSFDVNTLMLTGATGSIGSP
jgi:hypothetical protein